MIPMCQCRTDSDPTEIWEQSTPCDPAHAFDTIPLPDSNPNDPTGADGYQLMSIYPLQMQQRIIDHLSSQGYAGQVKRFATAVTLLADYWGAQYQNKTCADEDHAKTTSTPEKPIRGAKWTLHHYLQHTLPQQAPDLAKLPIIYAAISSSARADYDVNHDKIEVGNTLIHEIRHRQYVSVLSTLKHEKTHRDSTLTHRPITTPLVNEAITLAVRQLHNPHCASDTFRKIAHDQFWWTTDEDGNKEYVDNEDEIYARMTQIVFRTAHQHEQFRTASSDLESYQRFLHSHIAGIADKLPPLVAGIVYAYIEEVVKTDMPDGYPVLAANMTSDTRYTQVRSAMASYKTTHQICQSEQNPICQMPIDTTDHVLAEPSSTP